jgi:hypothetical protein
MSDPTPVPIMPTSSRGHHRDPRRFNVFLPALLLSVAVVGWAAFQTYQLVNERDALQRFVYSQETLVQNATKLRGQLQGIASETQQLANAGNANAQAIIVELRRRGVTINADGATPPAK